MITVDDLLSEIVSFFSQLSFSTRDNKTLNSLQNTISSPSYITEKQGNLCLQILNQPYIRTQLTPSQLAVLDDPTWDREFRIIPEVRRIFYIPAEADRIPILHLRHNQVGVIAIEFTFSTMLRNLLKTVPIIQIRSGSFYLAEYNEKNIFNILKVLEPYNFEIEESIQEHYKTICSWDKIEISNRFLIENIQHDTFNEMFNNDIGSTDNQLLIKDRQHRYQYTNSITCDHKSLTELIANRTHPHVWINSAQCPLYELISSLIQLQRAPILFVFDQATDLNTITQLNAISDALIKNDINDSVGIYFRLDNTPDGKLFNDTISNRCYNQRLTSDIKVAGVRAGKLPKFFLTESWRPMSIISINNTLRQSKTAIYAKCCDLIITYSENEPLTQPRNTWELD